MNLENIKPTRDVLCDHATDLADIKNQKLFHKTLNEFKGGKSGGNWCNHQIRMVVIDAITG